MAKKEGHKKSKSKKPMLWIAGTILVVLVILLVNGNILLGDSAVEKGKSFYVKGGETRPVLNPLMFTGMAREAYIVAKKYPEILDQVYCYCYCDRQPFNHKSLLSCFTDRHGAG